MRGPDDPGIDISQQHRTTVGSRDSDGNAWRVGDEAVSPGRHAVPGSFGHDDARRMDLIGSQQMLNPELSGHTCPILAHVLRIITRPEPSIEALVNTG
jgi:hypothetical protein